MIRKYLLSDKMYRAMYVKFLIHTCLFCVHAACFFLETKITQDMYSKLQGEMNRCPPCHPIRSPKNRCILHGFLLYFSACSINPPDPLLLMTVEAAAEVEVVLDV